MVNFRPMLIGLLLSGLFAMSLITGGIMLANLNNPSQSIAQDPIISNYSQSITSSLSQAYTDANTSETALSNSPITLTSQSFVFDALGGLWKTLKGMPITVYNLTVGLVMEKIFGANAFYVVIGVIGAIVTITIIFGVWKLIRTGESG